MQRIFIRPASTALLLALLAAAGLLVPGQVMAQAAKGGKDAQLVALADEVYRNSGARMQALEQYRLAIEANPDNLKANYMAGVCHLQTIQKELALNYLLHIYELKPDYESGMPIGADLYPDLLFLIGQAYHYGENFKRAQDYYRLFAGLVKAGKGSRAVRENTTRALKLTERRLFECKTGIAYRAAPVQVRISPLGNTNSDFPDYAPAVDRSEQTIVFTSRRPGGPAREVDNDLFYFEDIYISKRTSDTSWGAAELLPGVNSERHEASVALSADGNQLILYKDENGGDLYVSRKGRDGRFGKPRSISANVNSSFREASAFISPDGKRLYFSSDRPGGYGGLDLYVSEALDDANWGMPSNLGPAINTEYDDESPVFSFDGQYLFFSSKGHRGMGGYDIFRTSYDSARKEWRNPENMGYPINTADNDLYYVQGNDAGHAYFASARDAGTGDLDIYLIRPINPADSLLIKGPRVNPADLALPPLADDQLNRTADSLDAFARAGLSGADTSQSSLAGEFGTKDTFVRIRLVALDKTTGRLIDVKVTFTDPETGKTFVAQRSSKGNYLQNIPSDVARNWQMSAEAEGYQYRNMVVQVKQGERGERLIERRLELEPLALNRPRVLQNIYFDFDKFSLKKESYRELQLLENLLRQNKSMIVEVAGHTDFVGTDEYNQKLSQKRAASVVAYLRKRGLPVSRLRAKGYGRRYPIATNDDEKDGRELNRRTEFEIIGGKGL